MTLSRIKFTAKWFVLILLLTATGFGGCGLKDPEIPSPEEGASPLLVETFEGPVIGIQEDATYAFLGVPYASPPLGARRWRAPIPMAPWEATRAANSFESPCPQPTGYFVTDVDPKVPFFGEEDCLFLNVWVPADRSPDEVLPVMVFLHGGGNFLGSTADPIDLAVGVSNGPPLYDGAKLAARGRVIVVTLNYRLGVLGFLTEPSLASESASGTSGNYGLLDQIEALEWVQRNISRFGGDESRVTLFGQSGGARDVLLLTTSPLTNGLFHRAIIHSSPLGAQKQQDAVIQSRALVSELGCSAVDDVAACLRQLSPETLVLADAAQPLGLAQGAFRPSVDGHVVPGQPLQRIATGQAQDVPIMVGTVEVEYAHRFTTITDASYVGAVANAVGAKAAAGALAVYPLSAFGTAHEAFATLMSDRNVTCPHRIFARIAGGSGATVYLYRFRRNPSTQLRLGFAPQHTSELLFLFQHMDGDAFDADAADRDVSTQMLGYWSHFAATGDPNSTNLARWEPFQLSSDEAYLSIDVDSRTERDLKSAECDFWDSIR